MTVRRQQRQPIAPLEDLAPRAPSQGGRSARQLRVVEASVAIDYRHPARVDAPGVLEGIREGEHGVSLSFDSGRGHLDDHVREEVRLLHPDEGVADPFERMHRVDDRAKTGGLHEPQQPQGVGARARRGADDGHLAVEDARQFAAVCPRAVVAPAVTIRPPGRNRAQAVLPGGRADGVDDDVDGLAQALARGEGSWAPSSRARRRFSSERLVMMTCNPAARAMAMAAVATPPPAPWMSTRSPGCAWPRVKRSR